MFTTRGFVKKFQKKKLNSENRTRSVKVKETKTGVSHLYSSEKSVRNALFEILIYIVYLVVATIVANESHHLYMFYFNQTIERAFLGRTTKTHFNTEVSFNELVTSADWWNYLQTTFLDELHFVLDEHDRFDNNSGGEQSKMEMNNTTETAKSNDEEKIEDEDTNERQRALEDEPSENENENDEQNEDDAKDVKEDNGNNDGKDDDDDDEIEQYDDPETFDSDTIAKLSKRDKLMRLYLRDNILLGPPRLRQIRVKENSCPVHDAFFAYFKTCYGGYTRRVENRSEIYKGTHYFTMSKLRVKRIRGQVTTYYGAGYVKNLSFNRKTNEIILESLRKNDWIDRATRLVVLEFVLFNANTFMLDNAKILAEMLPVGSILPSHHFQALKFHSIWTQRKLGLYAAAVIFYGMTIYYTVEEVVQLLRTGLKRYLFSLWNLLDVTILVLAYLSLAYSIIHPLYLRRYMKKAKKQPYKFISIDHACYWNLLYIDMMGICVFLVWIKIFKYISFNKTMLQFSTTLRKCAKDLFGFAVMFFIVFLAYAQLGLLVFGTTHPDFRTFGISVITLMRMFLGDFEYELIEQANHILGPIYFLTYVLFVFFILLNMFLAIINDTYGAVKSEVNRGHSYFGSYLAKIYRGIFPFCFKKKRASKEADDTIMLTEKSHRRSRDNEDMALPSTTRGISHQPLSGNQLMSDNDVLREYFEELPESQQVPEIPKDNNDLKRLNNRITLLEDVLEQLITNMDRILKKVEAKGAKRT